ncbi:NOT2 family protein-like protein [Acephala macrosclerotiorum]|nr:NOT2 family protein-like protein [Acephala macrosclerotiorum]
MNRPVVGPQSLRGLPNGFPGQQQIPQNRSVSSRLPPSGKMASNGSTWAFGGGIPMGSAGLENRRANNGPMTSFAQTIGGSSQPQTPLDLSEFPSLSNNQPQPSQSTWAASGTRNLGQPGNMRLQQPSLVSQQQQQDDLFGSSSQLPSQGGFRFGSQNAVGQSSQPNSVDDFPPLNRNVNGDIGQDRNSTLMQNAGFGAQSNGLGFGSGNPPQPNRNNGLLNALSGSSRVAAANRVASPGSLSAVSNSRSPIEGGRPTGNTDNEPVGFSHTQFGSSMAQSQPEGNSTQPPTMARQDGPPQQSEAAGPRAQPANPSTSSSQANAEESGPEIEDPLADMSEIDKWGLKGFSFMMRNYPDYAALVTGADLSALGFDLASTEPFSNQIFSLFDNEPPRPAVPRFTLPECYTVGNVATLESKMSNFNDEALIFMFYSNPGDMQQVMAAQELHSRNWRYHKKLQLWLTKDDLMVPQPLGNGTERGYYIFFDIKQWHRERREFTLIYEDLENIPNSIPRVI